MDERHNLGRRAVWVAGGLLCACLLAAVAAGIARPRRFDTHEETIVYLLEQHSIAHERILLDHAWPDTVNTVVYGANVSVWLPGSQRANGRLECNSNQRACLLSLPKLGITREALPELTRTRSWPWFERLRQRLAQLARDSAAALPFGR